MPARDHQTSAAPKRACRPWAALTVVLSGTFLANLDVFIVVVALPTIHAQLGATVGQQQLVLAGYQLVYAVGLITGGRLGDVYGRFRVFGAGMDCSRWLRWAVRWPRPRGAL